MFVGLEFFTNLFRSLSTVTFQAATRHEGHRDHDGNYPKRFTQFLVACNDGITMGSDGFILGSTIQGIFEIFCPNGGRILAFWPQNGVVVPRMMSRFVGSQPKRR